MDVYKLEPRIGAVTSRHPLFKAALSAIVDWKTPAEAYPAAGVMPYPPADILAVRPDHFDRRINLQRSCFTFHLPVSTGHPFEKRILTPEQNPKLHSFKVSGKHKQTIRKELRLLGIDHFSVYGDLEHLAARLKEAYT